MAEILTVSRLVKSNEADPGTMVDFRWIDRGEYWESMDPQQTENWFLVKKGRPSGANCTACIGESSFADQEPATVALELAGKREKVFPAEARARMAYGNTIEPIARDWYSQSYGFRVEEVGFCVPKWNTHIGVSVDGVVYEPGGDSGIIEVKGPERMYRPLVSYMKTRVKPPGFDHIWKSHYNQMQMGMAILGKQWCDYIVYCPDDEKVFVQRIPFDDVTFNRIYSRLVSFIETMLDPLLADTSYPIMPPE